MDGKYIVVNSERSLQSAIDDLSNAVKKHKYARVKIDAGKRTLSQNALKAVWYSDIAKMRDDVTAKDVERECKYKYGLPILRRDAKHEYVFSKSVDLLPYEKRLVVMDCFAVTSVMSVSELKEYLTMMQNDHPYLSSEK